ncbi:LpqB family beta-propeller domain-containing protein [Nocardioides aurantiacus]|uniref:Sporulation and spore germination protein n=1 Tax=Nocardioides aurantiacus TaxID=86796 RepID=A0A3N2CVF9_9ACTN|nr:LpqB family beta-propeller domain-containing protein [Nocardioides aurantiacus]ROR91535.1 sporulation and spore germination protein [Nocardioides aurantiacus]
MRTAHGRRPVVALLLALALCAGCASLPESGPVRREAAAGADEAPSAPYFNPPGPAEDGSPAAIASGFLVAMQANPLSTKVAREFLTDRAARTWRPNRGTLVYEAFTVTPSGSQATVRLADVRRLDARGGWRGDAPGRVQELTLDLEYEEGQWRVEDPPDALVVPASFFDRTFERRTLYFFDPTGRTLLPDPVFIPRGGQSATNLVRGLLAGPGPALAQVTRSAFPRGTGLDLSVVVTESGVAEVPLTRELLRASPADLERAADQLAWTLRQVPDVARVRMVVGGAAVPLPRGVIDVPVSSAQDLDAAGDTPAVLYGLRGGRVVAFDGGAAEPVGGPLGRTGFETRSLAVSAAAGRVAAVSADGTTLFEAPLDQPSEGEGVRQVATGTGLLRPSYDLFGGLWLVDRTSAGARVRLVQDGVARELRVRGVTGESVTAAAVSHDGTRLAVALGGRAVARVRVVDVLRTDEGQVTGTGRSRSLVVAGEAAQAVDVGWRDPATLAVLSSTGAETSRVDYVSADGSPVAPGLVEPSLFRDDATALVVSPQADVPLRLVTADERLFTLAAGGSWPRTASDLVAATYSP